MKKVVVDVGAANIAKIEDGVIYYLFEPFEESYNRLCSRFQNNDNIKLYNFAVHDLEGEFDFYVTKKDECCSLLSPNLQNLKIYTDPSRFFVQKVLPVKTRRLDSIDALKDEEVIDVLKIDTQGTTYQVLLSCGELLDKTQKIVCESEYVEIYNGEVLDAEIEDFLIKKGFKREANLRDVKWANVKIFCDAVYTRNK